MGIFRQFPYTNFHDLNLDWIMEEVKRLATEWASVSQMYDDIKSAFDDFKADFDQHIAEYDEIFAKYMNDIDLEAEFNKALNKLLADGTITRLIQPVVVNTTNEWLRTHITQPSSVVVDDTLLVRNAVAESSETGRFARGARSIGTFIRTKDLKLTQIDFVKNQYWNSENGDHVYDEQKRFVSTPYLLYFPLKYMQPIRSKVTDGLTFSVIFYDKKFNYLGQLSGTNAGYCKFNNVEYIGINMRMTNNSDVTKVTFSFELDTLMHDTIIENKENKHITKLYYGKYYNTENGNVLNNANFAITDLIEIPADGMFMSNLDSKLAGVFFDENLQYVGYGAIRGRNTKDYTNYRTYPASAKYMGVTVYKPDGAYVESITDFWLYHVNGSGVIFGDNDPESYNDYMIMDKTYISNSGSVSATNNYNTAIIPNCDFDEIYAISNSPLSIVFFDRNNNVISSAPEYIEDMHYGRRYARPSNAYTTAVLFKTNVFQSPSNKIAQYFSLIYHNKFKKSTLVGTKTLCVGDSITWLDNTQSWPPGGDISFLEGYQKQIRKAGSLVDSIGINSGTYATGTGEPSIYEALAQITNISDYDNIILFGGLNDMRVNTPIGTIGDSYSDPNTDTTTFVGAIGKIIEFIRNTNPTCNILICTPLPTGDNTRPFEKLKIYRDAIIETALYWGIEVVDMSTLSRRDMATKPYGLTYDTTHPTNKGLEVMGKVLTGRLITDETLV